MTVRYAHTNIVAQDWQRLSAFYEATFGMAPVPPERRQSGAWLAMGTGLPLERAALQGVHLRLPGYGDDGPTLEIYQYAQVQPTHGAPAADRQGLGHLAFEVDDVEQCLHRVLENGGRAVGEIVETVVPGKGRITFVYAADPEGNILELQHWD